MLKAILSRGSYSKKDKELIKAMVNIDDKKPLATAKTDRNESPLTINSRAKRGSLASSDFTISQNNTGATSNPSRQILVEDNKSINSQMMMWNLSDVQIGYQNKIA